MSKTRSAAMWLVPLFAAAVTLVAFFVVGALVTKNAAAHTEGDLLLAVGVAGGLVLCVALPIVVNRLVVRALRKRKPKAPAHLAATLLGYNAVILVLAVVGLPAMTKLAVTDHTDWFVPGSTSATPPGASAAASGVPTGSAMPDAGAAPPLVLGDRDHSPQEIFSGRADSVVVLRTRSALSSSDPRSDVYGALGLRWIAGSGSGFVAAEGGIVVTNYHVAGEAEAIEVRLRDGRSFSPVKRLAQDKAHDLTVLGIDAKDLPVAPLAPDETISTGMRSIAIGSPLGMEYSVTDGIISAVRDMQGTTFLQMQTTIAPGSSGGPLFDTRGRVIGVNTGTRGAGLNLAVHVKYVRAVLAAPRSPQVLSPFDAGVRVATMTFEGASVTPIDRLNYEEPLAVFSQGAESCIGDEPADGRLTITYRREGGRLSGAKVDSTLPERALACLGKNIEMTSSMIGKLLVEHCRVEIESGTPVGLTVGLAGFPGEKGGTKPRFHVRYLVPKPGEEPDPDDDHDGDGDGDGDGDDDGTEAIEVP